MTKSKKNLAIVLVITIFLVLFGSLFAVFGAFAKPTKIVGAAETGTYAQLDGMRLIAEHNKKIKSLTFTNDISDFGSYSMTNALEKVSVGKTYDRLNNETGELYAYFYQNDSSSLYDCIVYAPAEKIYAPQDCSYFFGQDIPNSDGQSGLEKIVFRPCFDTSKTTNMEGMFCHLSMLKQLELSSFNTSKVTNMSGMFSCSFGDSRALNHLDLSMFDTSNVTDMSGMFYLCTYLRSVDVSSFNTSKVTNMRQMFCENGIEELDLSNFDTSNVTNMDTMFSFSVLQSLDLSSFDTSSVTDMSYMFYATVMTSLKLGNSFMINKSCNTENMFSEFLSGEIVAPKITDETEVRFINISGVATGFYYKGLCYTLKSNPTQKVEIFTKDTNGQTVVLANAPGLFKNGKLVKHWGWLLIDGDITTTDGHLKVENKNLEGDLVCDNVPNLTSLNSAFIGCSKLTSLDLSRLDTSGVTDMRQMFVGCSFKTLNLSGEFVIPSGCETEMMFCTPGALISMIITDDKEVAKILELSPKDRLTALCNATGMTINEEERDMYISMLSDSTICEIILPTSVSGEIALAPMSGQHYAYDSKSGAIPTLEASDGTNTKLTLYKDAISAGAEAEPVPFPTTPSGTSETGVVADISMIIIALASVISLAVVATKKKRVAR